MHPAAFVLSLLPLGSLVSAAVAGEPPVAALAKSCRFNLGNKRFDLCPIFESDQGSWTVAFERETPPTITKYEYRISLQGPLRRNRRTSNLEQCQEGTWICKTVTNTRPKYEDEDPRVLQVIPVAGELSFPNNDDEKDGGNKKGRGGKEGDSDEKGDSFSAAADYEPGINVTAKLVPADGEETKHDILHVHLHGGYYVYENQKADLQFVCDHEAEEPTSPTISWNWRGTHTFEWRTRHACGEKLAASPGKDEPPATPPAPKKPTRDPDAPPKDAEDPSTPGDHKMLDPDLLNRRSRSTMTVFASSAAFIMLVMYTLYYPPQRLQHFITSYVKTHPWLLRSRVGERILVRWAHEDFAFDAGEMDSEVDMMVNGVGQYEALAMHEQIPLKPSPRRPLLNNYGSAQ